MSNSVFHNIYTTKYSNAVSNVHEEDCSAMSMFRTLCLETVLNTFTWGGDLPKDCMPYMPERYLCWWNSFALFGNGGDLKLFPVYPAGALIENGQYDKYTAIAMNGKTWTLSRDEIALCLNNTLGTPSIGIINEMSTKMSNALRAVDITLERSCMPTVFETSSEEDLKTLTSLYDNTANRLPFRVMKREGIVSSAKAINEGFDIRQYDILSMFDVFTKYRNLFYQMFGVNTLSVLKKERVNAVESSGDSEVATFTLLDGMYNRRKEFCKEAKDKFGCNITFDINRSAETSYRISTSDEEEIENLMIEKGIETDGTDNSRGTERANAEDGE